MSDSSVQAGRRPGVPQGVVLLLATILPIMGVVSLAPVMPRLLQAFADTPNVAILVPVALTAPGLCIALLSPLAGVIADRAGRRMFLLAGLALYAVCGLAPLFLQTLPQILASRVGLGVAEAIIMTTTTTLMGDYFEGEERKTWVAIQAALGSLAASALFMAGGALGQLGWRGPFALYALAIPILAAVALLVWEPARRQVLAVQAGEASAPFPRAAMAALALVTLLCAILFYLAVIQLGLVLEAVGVTAPAKIGMVTALGSLGVPIGAFVYGRMRGWRVGGLLAVALACTGGGLIILGVARDVPTVFAGTFINQFGCGIMLPTLILWAMSIAPLRWRGRVIGLWNSAFFVGQFLSPLGAALMSRALGLGHTLTVFGIAAVAGALAAAVTGRKKA